jgi:CRISP-associated protein Cas1
MPTLVLTSDNLSVNVESRRLIVVRRVLEEDGKVSHTKSQVPLHDLDRVIIVGRPCISIPALQKIMFEGIPCYFTTAHHRWIGSLLPDTNKDAARRIRQYQASQDAHLQLSIARKLVEAKIANSRRVLQRLAANRQQSADPDQESVCAELHKLTNRAGSCCTVDELRGVEGLAAARYFNRLGAFFPESIPFKTRSRQPPKDAANAILSWTYTILLGEVECEIRTRGLDTCIGFLHELSHGSPSLALDLLEPLRAPIADLLSLNILNHRILIDESFEFRSEEGGVFLRQEAHAPFFQAYERAMTRKFALTGNAPHTDFRRIIADQVSALLKALDGDDNATFFKMP